MSYSARVLADSMSPDYVRLTTLAVVFPRFILAEFNTHRMFSRNSASSRAIPPELLIQRVRDDPFVPETFNKRVKGMGVGDELEAQEAYRAKATWLSAADKAADYAESLAMLDVDKSRVNRLLEPFLWHTCIVSSTEWRNFFALRDHEAAQPEMRITAQVMLDAMRASLPQPLNYGEWHLPLLHPGWVDTLDTETKKICSASRCARVSFDKAFETEPLESIIKRGERMRDAVPAHLSPFEHVARPLDPYSVIDTSTLKLCEPGDLPKQIFVNNFRGWVQMRREIPYESDAQSMIEAADAA